MSQENNDYPVISYMFSPVNILTSINPGSLSYDAQFF